MLDVGLIQDQSIVQKSGAA